MSPDGEDTFDVPFRIAPEPMGPGYYTVPTALTDGEGKPELLDLKDYNGDIDLPGSHARGKTNSPRLLEARNRLPRTLR